jgi:hypothetical protein
VVTFGDGRVFSTSDLGSAHTTWHEARLGSDGAAGRVRLSLVVACTSADICAAGGDEGTVWASPAPGPAGQRDWKRVADDRGDATGAYESPSIACAPAGLCVVVEPDGRVLSANAITRPDAWRQRSIAVLSPTT